MGTVDNDALEEWIDDQVAALLERGAECDPFDPTNFMEAIGNSDMEPVARHIADKADIRAILALRMAVYDYWQRKARSRFDG